MVSCSLLKRQRLLAAALLLAFLPTLTFLGHWGDVFGGTGAVDVILAPVAGPTLVDVAAQQAEKAAHALHCHTDLGSCSGQPVPAGYGLFVTRETLILPLPFVLSALVFQAAHIIPAPAGTPPTPPPRSA
jgi:hypothetical protein